MFTFETRQDADNAAREAGLNPIDVVCRDHDSGMWGWAEQSSESDASGDDVGASEVAQSDVPRVAQPGDVILQISGAMLPLPARIMAAQLAKKLGFDISLVDAFSGEVVATVAKGTKGEKSPRVVTPTTNQEKIIAACTRPQGATGDELFELGCGGNAKRGTIAWKQLVEACAKFGYSVECVAEMRQVHGKTYSKPIAVWHLVPEVSEVSEAA